jgi:hypothetical protein
MNLAVTNGLDLVIISRDIIELMPIAALMSANVSKSLGSNLNFMCDTPEQGM